MGSSSTDKGVGNSTDRIPTYGYGRISRQERDTGTISRDVQINTVQPHLGYKVDLDNVWFFDNGVSGSVPLANRPEGKKLLATAAASPCRIVVAKLDRLFRSGRDFYNTVAEWDKQGIQLVCVTEGFDMSTIFGRAVAGILAVVAELERNIIADRIRDSVKARRRAGRRYSADAPYGWRFEPTGKLLAGDRPEVAMVINEDEMSWTQLMIGWRKQGESYRKICARLTIAGCLTRHGQPWKAETVRVIVKRRLRELADAGPRLTKNRPIEKGEENEQP